MGGDPRVPVLMKLLLPHLRGRRVRARLAGDWPHPRVVEGEITGLRNDHFLVRDGLESPVEVLTETIDVA